MLPDIILFIIAITSVEIVAAITRRSRGGSIGATDAATACNQFRSDFQADYQVVEVTQNIINSAMTFAEIYGLRGYDAMQLAAGCAVNALCLANGLPALTLVSADNELNVAALNEGLVVENPNNYP